MSIIVAMGYFGVLSQLISLALLVIGCCIHDERLYRIGSKASTVSNVFSWTMWIIIVSVRALTQS